jgi:hypothetical protein
VRDTRIDLDPDFIVSPKHGNSLTAFMEDYPEGVSDTVIARVLRMSEKEVQETYERAIMKLRKVMKADE